MITEKAFIIYDTKDKEICYFTLKGTQLGAWEKISHGRKIPELEKSGYKCIPVTIQYEVPK
jgi:hypothetical protein